MYYIRGEIEQNAQKNKRGRNPLTFNQRFLRQREEKSGGRYSLGKSEEGGEEKRKRKKRGGGKLGRGRNRARRTNLFVNFRNLNVRGVSIKRRALRHVHTCTRAYTVHTPLPLERLLSSPV